MAASTQRAQKYKQRSQNRPPAARTARVPLMADAENVTRWIVDQQFRETQIQLGIPLGEFVHTEEMFHTVKLQLQCPHFSPKWVCENWVCIICSYFCQFLLTFCYCKLIGSRCGHQVLIFMYLYLSVCAYSTVMDTVCLHAGLTAL